MRIADLRIAHQYCGLMLLAALAIPASLSAAGSKGDGSDAGDTRTLVQEAAALIEVEGEAAFAEFRKEGSKWRHADQYVMVHNPQGDVIVNPAFPELEGKNEIGLSDVDGRPIVAAMVGVVGEPARSGWVHYRWPKPGEKAPQWKHTYAMQATSREGRHYIVASGLYSDEVEHAFVEDTVDRAAWRIEHDGDQAFQSLRNKIGAYRYMDVYVYVFDDQGTSLVNPAFPNLEGADALKFSDATGCHPTEEIIATLHDSDAAWVGYMWPKPGHDKPVHKSAYVRKVHADGTIYYVGAGIYE